VSGGIVDMSGNEPKMRKSYSRPQLKSYGSIKDLTKGIANDDDDLPLGGGSEE
jgi:hypothetical protein